MNKGTMFLKRNELMKKKIVGGNLIGNLFNKAKGVLYNTAKLVLPKAKGLAKMTTQKALKAAKDQITADVVLDLAKDAFRGDKQAIKQKVSKNARRIATTIARDGELEPDLRDIINRLATSDNVKKTLAKKGKELLQQQNSRAILSNLVAGSGLKKL